VVGAALIFREQIERRKLSPSTWKYSI